LKLTNRRGRRGCRKDPTIKMLVKKMKRREDLKITKMT